MGHLVRWRERKGEALGAESPASTAFIVTLHEDADGETFVDVRASIIPSAPSPRIRLVARKYPGGGTRFMTAAELTRWGMRANPLHH